MSQKREIHLRKQKLLREDKIGSYNTSLFFKYEISDHMINSISIKLKPPNHIGLTKRIPYFKFGSQKQDYV